MVYHIMDVELGEGRRLGWIENIPHEGDSFYEVAAAWQPRIGDVLRRFKQEDVEIFLLGPIDKYDVPKETLEFILGESYIKRET